MTKYGIAFIKTDSCEEDDGIYDICGLTYDFFGKTQKEIIENDECLNKILQYRKHPDLSDVLGEAYCMKIINKDEDLLKYCEIYDWKEVVNGEDRDKFLRHIYDSEDEDVIDGFFERLGYFAMTITTSASCNGLITFVLPIESKEREHLKENLENIYNGYGYYEIYVCELDDEKIFEKDGRYYYKGDIEDNIVEGSYYYQGELKSYYKEELGLGDDDIDYILESTINYPDMDELFVVNDCNGYFKDAIKNNKFKKYKLIEQAAE